MNIKVVAPGISVSIELSPAFFSLVQCINIIFILSFLLAPTGALLVIVCYY